MGTVDEPAPEGPPVRPPTADGTDDHPYGGEHHPFSLVDRLGDRVAASLGDDLLQRDPAFIRRFLPALDAGLRWFDPEVTGFGNLPAEGPFLVVGNHSGGIYMPDHWAFLREWVRRRGADAPLYALTYDLIFSMPGFATFARKLGSVPASPANADRLLQAGQPVLVYPGGDEDDYRPWTERHHVDLHGRTGFVRVALHNQVPVVPMVGHGAHDVLIVVTSGERLARALGLERLRIRVMPFVVGVPWGIVPVPTPVLPLPAKVRVQVCEPIDWSHLGPDAADDPEVVARCYEEITGVMQSTLDGLVAGLPHPVATRVGTAMGLDRLGRLGRLGR